MSEFRPKTSEKSPKKVTESGHILYDLRDKKLVRRQNSDELELS